MELRPVCETLDRFDRLAVGFDRQRGARADRSPVEEHRACSADLHVAAQLRTHQTQAPDELDEQHLILDLDASVAAVELELDLAPAHRYDACARSDATARCANTPTTWRLYSTDPARSAIGSTAARAASASASRVPASRAS